MLKRGEHLPDPPSGFHQGVKNGGHVIPKTMTIADMMCHWHLTPLSQNNERCAIESTSQRLIILGNGAAESATLTEVNTP